jgi:4-hydroxythreonine-4-phosphate dehydrogenase
VTGSTRLVIIADDLSGAAETAGAIAGASGPAARVWLGDARAFALPVEAVDTGSRSGAGTPLAGILDRVPVGAIVYKKIDSLLRGPIGDEVAVLRSRGLPVLLVAAVPRIGRTVRGGVVHLGGVPLHESDAWAAEAATAPTSIPDALGAECALLPLGVVRSAALVPAVRDALAAGLIPVCDTETEADLDAIAAALPLLDPRLVVVASAGLARSVAAQLGLAAADPRFAPGAERVVAVIGTRTASARRQVAALVADGFRPVELGPGVSPHLVGDCAVTLADGEWDGGDLDAAFSAVARAIAELPGRTDLVLTGGDTARRMLDALGTTALFPEAEVHDGAVLSTTPDGAGVVTRPGSYGADDSLVRIAHHLKGLPE